MVCNNCGTTISEGEKFCPECGEPVKNQNISQQQNSYNDNYNYNYNHNDDKNYYGSYNNSNVNYNQDGAFYQVGEKIETYAKVVWYVNILIAIILFIISLTTAEYTSGTSILYAIIIGAVIILVGYISSLIIYGYGKLIENVEEIKDILNKKENK